MHVYKSVWQRERRRKGEGEKRNRAFVKVKILKILYNP